MKAVQIKTFGAAEVLELADLSVPVPGIKELLIRVSFAGINPVDAKIRSGSHISCATLKLPTVLGKELSGIVIETGSGVSEFKKGDEVFGFASEAYAEYALAKEELIVKKPPGLSFMHAAGISLVGLTAWQAINRHLQVGENERVLIQSAAGGVGHIAAQLAKLNGTYVYGTASAENESFLHSIGVDRPINYREEDFTEVISDLDVVMDTMGGEFLYRSIESVKPGGRVVCLPSYTKDDPKAIALAKSRDVKLIWFMVEPYKSDLENISALLKDEKLLVEVQEVFDVNHIREAHKRIESQSVRGKIILEI